MEQWLVLGLMAAVSFGIAGLFAKVTLSSDYLDIGVRYAAVLTMFGVMLGFMIYLMITGLPTKSIGFKGALAGLSVGLFWALGQILVYYAFSKGADASKMAPIYNLNTLIVVLAAIVLLGELPERQQILRVITGAILIVTGGILVSI